MGQNLSLNASSSFSQETLANGQWAFVVPFEAIKITR
jgi:hypothetical protein